MNIPRLTPLAGAVSLFSLALAPVAAHQARSVPDSAPRALDAAPPGDRAAGEVSSDLERVVRRANTFLASSQDATALATDRDGNWVVVWHSRRQEEGNYGVYARRFDPTGKPLSGETRINATLAGMQMQPCLDSDDQGGVWFAWRSFLQDGDEGGIVVRRFDAGLERATAERIVNATTAGHQSDPSIAALPGGRALAAWTGPAADGSGSGVFGRMLDAEGAPDGPERRLDGGTGRARLPHVATDASGRAVVCWARTDAEGTPNGIFARAIGADGEPRGEEFRVDPTSSVQPVEPTLSMTPDGDVAIAWLDLRGDEDPVVWRRYTREAGELRPGPVHERRADGPGYTNGHAIDLAPDGQVLVAWSRHGGRTAGTRLFAQVFDGDGTTLTEAFRVHDLEGGDEKLAVGRGTSRARLLGDGRMGFAWHGDGGLGDSSGAHISVLLPRGFEPREPEPPSAEPASETPWEPAEEGAAPHEPPTFGDRPFVERPSRGTLQLGSTGTFDFLGITDTGWTPADPHMAVGPDHIVLVTNGGVAYFDTAGTFLFQDELEGVAGFFGSVGASNFVIDPEVLWDPHAQRFLIVAAERASGQTQPYFLLAISDDADPSGTWHKYRINALAASGGQADIDSPNIGVDENVVYLGADFPATGNFLVMMIDKTSILGGGAAALTDTLITGKTSMGIPITHDSGAPAQYMIRANKVALSNQVEFFAITDALATPIVQSTTLTLPAVYQATETVPQKGTSSRIEIFDARFWSCVYRDGSLWATHHTGSTQAVQRWYEFDMQGWPGSGQQPVLVQFGTIAPEFPIRAFFGSIAVDAVGNMALLYARSSPDEFVSLEQVTRGANDPLGATQPPIQVYASSDALAGRRGDYGACVADPDEVGVFWGHHEYAESGAWNTRVARFLVCPLGEPYCTSTLHSTGLQARIGNAGTPRVSENDFHLTVADGPPNKFGIFFYGPNQIQVTFGDGFRCVGGMTQRLNPVVMTSGGGSVSQRIELTAPQAALIAADTTWNFQFWFRDPMGPGGSGFNLSDGIRVQFCE